MKKFLISVIILFVGIFAFGCAEVNYFFKIETNGKISYGFNIIIDEAKIIEAHSKNSAENETLEKLKLKLLSIFSKQELSTKMMLSTGNLTLKEDYSILNEQKNENGFLYHKFVISFSSQYNYLKAKAIFKKFEELNGENIQPEGMPQPKTYVERNFLTRKTIFLEPSVFCEDLLNQNKIIKDLIIAFKSFNIQTDIKLSQTYITTDTRLKSNANKIKKNDGLVYHTWNLNSLTATENNIKTFYVSPNPSGWYVLTIVIVGVFMLGYLIYVVYKSPLKKQIK